MVKFSKQAHLKKFITLPTIGLLPNFLDRPERAVSMEELKETTKTLLEKDKREEKNIQASIKSEENDGPGSHLHN